MKRRAATRLVLRRDRPAEACDQRLDDREAELAARGDAGSRKRLEGMGERVRGDARAAAVDDDGEALAADERADVESGLRIA